MALGPFDPAVASEMDAAERSLEEQVGRKINTVLIRSGTQSDAAFLGQNISKLSPLIGNLMEYRIVNDLAAREGGHGLEWRRQDPYFPDAALFDSEGVAVGAGFEIKAWYALSTELTARFRESVNLLIGKDVRLLIVAWAMDRVILGVPEVLGVLVVDGESVARQRDRHYHDPPRYLIVEPEDTVDRTANLQQSNVNGFRLQGAVSAAALRLCQPGDDLEAEPHTPQAQDLASALRSIDRYRGDTNFAKIDRIAHPEIERFKTQVLNKEHRGRQISGWISTLSDLSSGSARRRRAAEGAVRELYED